MAGGGLHDGTTAADAWTFAEAIAGYAAGHRINVLKGTYANTTTARTLSTAGTTTAPVWWRGYASTIGDLDAAPTTARVPGTDMPEITFTTALLTISGANQHFSNISFSGARTAGTQVTMSGGNAHFDRCRIINTGANAASSAIQISSAGNNTFTACYFQATSTATRVFDCSRHNSFDGCAFAGGGIGLEITATTAWADLVNCIFNDCGSDGLKVTTATNTTTGLTVGGCTFYSCGGSGINIANAGLVLCRISGNIFSVNAAYGINNSSGTNTNVIQRSNNAFYNNTSGTENGLGDDPTFHDVTESSDPFTAAASANFGLVTGALSIAAGCPGLYEGL